MKILLKKHRKIFVLAILFFNFAISYSQDLSFSLIGGSDEVENASESSFIESGSILSEEPTFAPSAPFPPGPAVLRAAPPSGTSGGPGGSGGEIGVIMPIDDEWIIGLFMIIYGFFVFVVRNKKHVNA
ncbi:MAG: hypothetical protein IJ270_02275 [Paludibacteraceae bacterium]|jgi:hypothetical protein|nr:hypothetical protein [Paludibacteraceae bacterium]